MIKQYLVALLSLLMISGSCKKEDALAGIDKKALFKLPTAEELALVRINWQHRDLTPRDVVIEEVHAITRKINYYQVSFRLYGQKQYMGVLVPVVAKPLPVQLYVYGFGLDEPVSRQNIKLPSSDTASLPFVYIVPALRGQSLIMQINDATYQTPVSEGTRNDAFDGATDDAIACLNAVAIAFKEADTAKVMVRGGSRGGTVALLMAERDKRVKLAAAIAFPSELVVQTASHQNDPTYRFQFLEGLINGSVSIQDARLRMIASSPLYFCQSLPKTQIHFGDQDDITPARQGQLLFDAMRAANLQDSITLFIYKGRGHHDIGSNNKEMEERIEAFFRQLL